MVINMGFHEKMERLNFLYYCLRKSGDKRFMKQVRELGKESNLVLLQNSGGQNREILYYIDLKDISTGFFAVYNRLLSLLYFADRYGLKSVVRYGQSFPYAEEHPINGTSNPFEYYFKQPCGLGLSELGKYNCILVSRKENGGLANELNSGSNGYSKSELFIQEMGEISSKYIRLNDDIKERINKDMDPLNKKCALGVHVRGTDFKKNYNGHPVQISIDKYLKETIKLFQTGRYQQVFLATDDLDAYHLFKKQFGNKLFVYEDVIRSAGDNTVMNSKSSRNNHHYLLGLEVLRDMHSLAACESLVAGLSQVSYAARIQKKSMGQEFSDLSILSKGINYHKRENCPV